MYNGSEVRGLSWMLILKCKNWSVVKKLISVFQVSSEFRLLSLFAVLTENLCCDLYWKIMLLEKFWFFTVLLKVLHASLIYARNHE